MDIVTPAFREMGRHLRRGSGRLALMWRRRQLVKAQTALGLLGWQQADFDPETQREVEAIQNVEREQGRLINEAAERGATIRQLRSQLEALRRGHQEQRRAAEAEARKVREAQADRERRLAVKRKNEPNFERRIPELDRELREVNGLLADALGAERQSPKLRQEIVRLRERTVAIPNEKNDLRTQHFRIVSEIHGLEQEIERQSAAVQEEARRLEVLAAKWESEERELAGRIREEEREKAAREKRVAELESAKTNPYQQIGQVLALANVAPMNQPQALITVKELELTIGGLHQELLESQQASASENRRLLRISYAVLALLAFLVALIVFVALR